MKRVIIVLSALSILSAGAVTPVLGMRFNDVAGASALPDAVTSIGLKMEVTDGVNAGFDSNVTGDADFRIYLERSFGKIGFGHNAAKEPTFTIGGMYSIYSNLNVEVEYLVNTMTKTSAVADQLRLSLTVPF
jgi:hypothetical protein